MDDRQAVASTPSTIERRELLQRGAFVAGAAALWATPVVQTLGARPAAAGTRDFLECDTINFVVYEYIGDIECLDFEVRRAAPGNSGGGGSTGEVIVEGSNLGGAQHITFAVGGGNPDYDFFVKDACGDDGDWIKVGDTHLSCSATADALPGFTTAPNGFKLIGVDYNFQNQTFFEGQGFDSALNDECFCPAANTANDDTNDVTSAETMEESEESLKESEDRTSEGGKTEEPSTLGEPEADEPATPSDPTTDQQASD